MSQHNLTQRQLKALRWIVQYIKEGKIEESFNLWYVVRKPEIRGLGETLPEFLDPGTLHALTSSNVLLVENTGHKSPAFRYTLTALAYEITDFDFSNPEPDPVRDYMKQAYQIMESRFSNPELKTLCFQLDINPDRVFAADDLDWPRQLLLYLYRRQRLGDLVSVINRHRKDIEDWPPYPS